MGIVSTYNKVNKLGKSNIIRKYPKAHFPQLTNEDYKRGYFIRYFLKLKSNKNSIITEVDSIEYSKFSGNSIVTGKSMFNSFSLRWKIIGKREDVINGNTRTVDAKELLMPGIRLKLGNRLQFWKDL